MRFFVILGEVTTKAFTVASMRSTKVFFISLRRILNLSISCPKNTPSDWMVQFSVTMNVVSCARFLSSSSGIILSIFDASPDTISSGITTCFPEETVLGWIIISISKNSPNVFFLKAIYWHLDGVQRFQDRLLKVECWCNQLSVRDSLPSVHNNCLIVKAYIHLSIYLDRSIFWGVIL